MTPTRRYARGAGALVAVLLLLAVAGAALATYYAAEDDARRRALDRAAGRTFAAWMLAAHRASQERDFSGRLAGGTGFALTAAELRGFGAVPPGLPDRAGPDTTFTVGIVDDGAGVAMAFGVLESPRDGAVPAMRGGAVEAGLAALVETGGDETPMTARLPAIERALGRPLPPGTLYATADWGVRYQDDVLYRRPQPGRPWLNRMETVLDAGGHDLRAAGDATGRSATVAGDAEADGGAVDGDAAAARVRAASLEAGELGAAALAVSAALLVGRIRVVGAVSAGSVAATGRLEAGGLQTTGELTADTLAAAQSATVDGASSVRALDGETVTASGPLQTQRAAASGVFGARAHIDDLTVTQCQGC